MKRAAVVIAVVIGVAFGLGMALQAQEKAPTTVILKGSPMGGVKFDHATHSKLEGVKCEQCHHASKPEKAAKAAQENCTDCHEKTAAPPMKTKLQAAFHDPMAKKGTCIDCHLEKNKAGKKAPTKCAECHKKENV
jgi:hypothetical protein